MKPSQVRLFIKPYCGWCHEAIAWLKARGIAYNQLDVTSNQEAYREMVELTGQSSAPCMDADGEILADFGVDELEEFWKRFEE
ncbi:MAG: NrdH-redoxin [Verrucomicrobiales bacterium]|nr:NrdH-redoxin [Verrucomicrobiales bacterium]|tara:strand:+ start:114 stop:362 length:249 start_codon:yes stop_codon:yes gene_type:complete